MSLRNEIEKILCDFATQSGNLVDTSKSSEATSQILSLLEQSCECNKKKLQPDDLVSKDR